MKIRINFVSNSSTCSFIVRNNSNYSITVDEVLDMIIFDSINPEDIKKVKEFINNPNQHKQIWEELSSSERHANNPTEIKRGIISRLSEEILSGQERKIDLGNNSMEITIRGNKEIQAFEVMYEKDCTSKIRKGSIEIQRVAYGEE